MIKANGDCLTLWADRSSESVKLYRRLMESGYVVRFMHTSSPTPKAQYGTQFESGHRDILQAFTTTTREMK